MSTSGLILILVGGVLLANNLGWLHWEWLRLWWPALLIALGAWSMISHRPADNERGGQPRRKDPNP